MANKVVSTYISVEDLEKLKKITNNKGTTPYAVFKGLIKGYIEENEKGN